MLTNLPGVRPPACGSAQTEKEEEEVVCEECLAAKNSLHCIDASIQVDLSDTEEEDAMGRKEERRHMPVYSKEDIREQYCINDKEAAVLDSRKRRGLLGCFSDHQGSLSPCTRQGKRSSASILTSCMGRRSGSDEETTVSGDSPANPGPHNDRRPVSPPHGGPGRTWIGGNGGGGQYATYHDHDDGYEDNYFRRRPKSFCMEGRRYGGGGGGGHHDGRPLVPQLTVADETYLRSLAMVYPPAYPVYHPHGMLRPPLVGGWSGPGYAPCANPSPYQVYTQPNTPDLLLHRKQVEESEVSLDDRKPKHVSFDTGGILRSQTVAAMQNHLQQNHAVQQNHANHAPASAGGHQPPPPTPPAVAYGAFASSADLRPPQAVQQRSQESHGSSLSATPSKSSERLIDGRKTPDYALYSELFTPELARQIVLDRLKKTSMRTQATQTDVRRQQLQQLQQLEQMHLLRQGKAHMVSEGVQTNGGLAHAHSSPRRSKEGGPRSYGGNLVASAHRYDVKVYNVDPPHLLPAGGRSSRRGSRRDQQRSNGGARSQSSENMISGQDSGYNTCSKRYAEITSPPNHRSKLMKSLSSDGILQSKEDAGPSAKSSPAKSPRSSNTASRHISAVDLPPSPLHTTSMSIRCAASGADSRYVQHGASYAGDVHNESADSRDVHNESSDGREFVYDSDIGEKLSLLGSNSSIQDLLVSQAATTEVSTYCQGPQSHKSTVLPNSKAATNSSSTAANSSSIKRLKGSVSPPTARETSSLEIAVGARSLVSLSPSASCKAATSSPRPAAVVDGGPEAVEGTAACQLPEAVMHSGPAPEDSQGGLTKPSDHAQDLAPSGRPSQQDDGTPLQQLPQQTFVSSSISSQHMAAEEEEVPVPGGLYRLEPIPGGLYRLDDGSSEDPASPLLQPASSSSSRLASTSSANGTPLPLPADHLKSPASETSSSSGSYSVTSESKEDRTRSAADRNTQSRLPKSSTRLVKEPKAATDLLIVSGGPDVCKQGEREDGDGAPEVDQRLSTELAGCQSPERVTSAASMEPHQSAGADSANSQRKLKENMKLNLAKEGVKMSGWGRSANQPGESVRRKPSLDSIARMGGKAARTPSSVLAGEEFTPSPTLARSPAMHEGFRLRDWRVERTPINTPDSDLTSRVPQKANDDDHDDYDDDDDEEEDEEEEENDVHDSLSLNSDTDLGSRCSGLSSSFLPSSISESLPAGADTAHNKCAPQGTLKESVVTTESAAGKESADTEGDLAAGKESADDEAELAAGKESADAEGELAAGKESADAEGELAAGKELADDEAELAAGKESADDKAELATGRESALGSGESAAGNESADDEAELATGRESAVSSEESAASKESVDARSEACKAGMETASARESDEDMMGPKDAAGLPAETNATDGKADDVKSAAEIPEDGDLMSSAADQPAFAAKESADLDEESADLAKESADFAEESADLAETSALKIRETDALTVDTATDIDATASQKAKPVVQIAGTMELLETDADLGDKAALADSLAVQPADVDEAVTGRGIENAQERLVKVAVGSADVPAGSTDATFESSDAAVESAVESADFFEASGDIDLGLPTNESNMTGEKTCLWLETTSPESLSPQTSPCRTLAEWQVEAGRLSLPVRDLQRPLSLVQEEDSSAVISREASEEHGVEEPDNAPCALLQKSTISHSKAVCCVQTEQETPLYGPSNRLVVQTATAGGAALLQGAALREEDEEGLVEPPAGFADSPERRKTNGGHRPRMNTASEDLLEVVATSIEVEPTQERAHGVVEVEDDQTELTGNGGRRIRRESIYHHPELHIIQDILLPPAALPAAPPAAPVPEETAAGRKQRKLSSTSCPGDELLPAPQQRSQSSCNVLKSEEMRMRKFSLTGGAAESLPRSARHQASANQSSSVENVRKSANSGSRSEIRQRSRSKSSERLLQAVLDPDDEVQGLYTGEYQKHAWVYVGEIPHPSTKQSPTVQGLNLVRSASMESTQSEREFSKQYQAITHRMVHRKSTSIMYSRIQERTFDCNKTVTVERVAGEFGFRIHGSRPVVVSAIEPNTPASSSGLCVGDILLTVNGINVLDLPHTEVVKVAQKCVGSLELGVATTLEEGQEGRGWSNVWEELEQNQQVMMAGILWKKKRSVVPNQQWTKRWFVLRADNCLYSFKTEMDSRPSGALLLPGCSVSQLLPDGSLLTIKIVRPDGASVQIGAESPEEGEEWRSILASAATSRRSQSDIWLEVVRSRSILPAAGHPMPDCRGVLQQLLAGEWTSRSLVLIDGCLYIYKDDQQPASGVIFLHGYKAQPVNAGGRRYAFELIPTDPELKHYFFLAQTENEKKRWLAALEFSIDRWMRLS